MISDFQWYWFFATLICGMYASLTEARRKGHAYIRVRNRLRFHVYASTFLTIFFTLLLVMSVAT